MKIKTKQFTLSLNDQLPNDIDDPIELIQKITRKVAINSKCSNFKNVFLWVKLAEDTLERYSNLEDKSILYLQINLAMALYYMGKLEKSKNFYEKIIDVFQKLDRVNKKSFTSLYYNYARILLILGDYETAETNINNAIKLNKKSAISYSLKARILTYREFYDSAEFYYKLAIENSKKNGKMHIEADYFYDHGISYYKIGNYILAKKYLYKAYQIRNKIYGKENLCTIFTLCDIAAILYFEKEYIKAYKIYKTVYTVFNQILGKDNNETQNALYNCTLTIIMIKKHNNIINHKTLDIRSHYVKTLIIMKKYSEVIGYLKSPFVILGKNELFLLLDYDNITMDAPKVILSIKGSSVGKIAKIMENKNIPITKNSVLAKEMIENCPQFRCIPKKYWNDVAKIMGPIK
ncbi:MAG: tetratricopeptide repeat protein [Treponema sp.]|nr:tetratricopeptide repeat protein [Treponema sp.]